jgi:hypothetical protein
MPDPTPRQAAPSVRGTSLFVPARDWHVSRTFYRWLCGDELWCEGTLAAFRLGGTGLLVQDRYVKDWAENAVLIVDIDDVDAWHRHLIALRDADVLGGTALRIQPPRDEPWGARVVTTWDPAGVLLHFAQRLEERDE